MWAYLLTWIDVSRYLQKTIVTTCALTDWFELMFPDSSKKRLSRNVCLRIDLNWCFQTPPKNNCHDMCAYGSYASSWFTWFTWFIWFIWFIMVHGSYDSSIITVHMVHMIHQASCFIWFIIVHIWFIWFVWFIVVHLTHMFNYDHDGSW